MTLTNDNLRQLERVSIVEFLNDNATLLTGRVLDYGCGRQPYADIIRRVGGDHVPYDRAELPANVSGADVGPDEDAWGDLDAILFTQVIQYIPDPLDLLGAFCDVLRGGDPGVLVATGPTTWPVVEPEDLWRLTPAGATALLVEAGFRRVDVQVRSTINTGAIEYVVGWQAIAYA